MASAYPPNTYPYSQNAQPVQAKSSIIDELQAKFSQLQQQLDSKHAAYAELRKALTRQGDEILSIQRVLGLEIRVKEAAYMAPDMDVDMYANVEDGDDEKIDNSLNKSGAGIARDPRQDGGDEDEDDIPLSRTWSRRLTHVPRLDEDEDDSDSIPLTRTRSGRRTRAPVSYVNETDEDEDVDDEDDDDDIPLIHARRNLAPMKRMWVASPPIPNNGN